MDDIYKIRVETEAQLSELDRYQAKLREMSATAAASSRASMAADQAAWEAKREALKAEMAMRAQLRDLNASDAATRDRFKAGIGQGDAYGYFRETEAMRQNADACESLKGAKKGLLAQLKVVGHELGKFPGFYEAITVVKNPVVAAVLAISAAMGALKRYIAAVNEEAQNVRGLQSFMESMESLRVSMGKVARENDRLFQDIDLGKHWENASEAVKNYTDSLKEALRLQTELIDAELAAEEANIEAQTNLTPDEKSRAKAAVRKQARDAKDRAEEENRQRTLSATFRAARDSERESQDYAKKFVEQGPLIADARRKKEDADAEAARRKSEYESKAPDIQKRMEWLESYMAKGQTFGERMPDWFTAMTKGVYDSASAERSLEGLKQQLGLLKSARDNAAALAESAGQKVTGQEAIRSQFGDRAKTAARNADAAQAAFDKMVEDGKTRSQFAPGLAGARARKDAAEAAGAAGRQQVSDINAVHDWAANQESQGNAKFRQYQTKGGPMPLEFSVAPEVPRAVQEAADRLGITIQGIMLDGFRALHQRMNGLESKLKHGQTQ